MPGQTEDPRVHKCYVVKNGEKVEVTKRRVSAAEVKRRRDVALAEEFAASDDSTPASNTGEPQAKDQPE